MKKLLILSLIFVTILVLAACSSKEPAKTSTSGAEAYPFVSGGSLAKATSKAPVTTSAPITTLPEIDMDALYKKVFEDTSVYLGGSELKEIKDPDPSKNEILFYIQYSKDPSPSNFNFEITEYYTVKDISSDIIGECDKYSVKLHTQSVSPYRYTQIKDYYHSAYIDVLLTNLTYQEALTNPTEIKLFKVLTINDGENLYTVYNDMSLYKSNGDGSKLLKADQTVDMPYLYMMANVNEFSSDTLFTEYTQSKKEYKFGYLCNSDKNLGKVTEKYTVKDSRGKDRIYYLTENGTLYTETASRGSFHEDGTYIAVFVNYGDNKRYYLNAKESGIFDELIGNKD